jgi:hypothetical protein
MKTAVCILFLILAPLAFAIPANFNGDCIVNIADLAVIAGQWQETGAGLSADLNADQSVDLADLILFADSWLEYENQSPPIANNISQYALRGSDSYINITAQDEGLPDPPGALVYQVTSLPLHGTLYDPANTDPAYLNPDSTDAGIIEIEAVPYTLTDTGARILYSSEPGYAGSISFDYSVSDGGSLPCGGQASATVAILNNGPPYSSDSAVSAYAYEPILIDLVAEDNGLPNPPARLKYIVTAMPSTGSLLDVKSGAGIIQSRYLPYTLSSWTDDVLFYTSTVGADAFQFRANDSGSYPSGGDSQVSTVTVNVAEHPKDSLSFNAAGYVTFEDNTNYDIKPGFAVHLYIRTHSPFCPVAKKRGTTGGGYVLDLVSGRPRLKIYDAGGNAVEVRAAERIDNGQWKAITAGLYQSGTEYRLQVSVNDNPNWTVLATVSDYDNAEPFVLGSGFRGDIDKLRFFSAWNPDAISGMIIELDGRTGTTELVIGFGVASAVRYMLDEHSGLTVTDDKLSLTGTLSNIENVRWYPFIDPFVDSSVLIQDYN